MGRRHRALLDKLDIARGRSAVAEVVPAEPLVAILERAQQDASIWAFKIDIGPVLAQVDVAPSFEIHFERSCHPNTSSITVWGAPVIRRDPTVVRVSMNISMNSFAAHGQIALP